MRITRWIIAGLVAGAMCLPAMAQDHSSSQAAKGTKAASQSGSMNNNGGSVSSAEQQFVTKASQSDRAEVELANLALQKSNNPDVKQFAQRMVDDHSKNQQQVDSLASQLSITAPGSIPAEAQHEKDRLSNMSGDQFDRAYARMMVQDHRKDVNEFKQEQQSAQNSQLKQYVDQTLPVLEQHLQMAEQLQSKVGNNSSSH